MAVFRFLLGLLLLYRWLPLAAGVELLLSNRGIYFPAIELPAGGPTPAVAWILYGLAVGSAVTVTIGLATRASLTLQLAILLYHYVVYFHATYFSYDQAHPLLVGILLLSPCGRALSVDAWLAGRRGRLPPRTYELWTQRLVQTWVIAMYFGSGLFKVVSPLWANGELLYHTLQGFWASEVAFRVVRLGLPPGIYDLVTTGTVLFELYIPVLLIRRRLRTVAFVAGVTFHVTIGLFLGIWEFMVLPASYVLFIEPRRVSHLSRQLSMVRDRFGLVSQIRT